jgi:hypothetical protein
VAHIRDIHIIGAKAFSESTLTDQMELTTGGWLTWYTKSDRYSRTKLNSDLEKLRAYYLNRGYLEFDITATQVTISPDKQTISITITINEGQPYTVTGVRLEGNFLGREAEFRNLVTIKPGSAYTATTSPRPPAPSPTCTAPTATPSRTSSRARRPTARRGRSSWCCWPSRVAARTCAASTWPATRSRATR